MVSIIVDLSAALPPYEQIRSQITALIGSGQLHLGDRLPPVRALARDLGLAAGTVARAYRELEHDGAVETHGRAGTVISRAPAPPDPALVHQLDDAVSTVVAISEHLGLSPDTLGDLVRMRARGGARKPGPTS